MVATLAGSGTAAASHRAAALLHGLDGFDQEVLEISVAARLHPQLPRVTMHRSTPSAAEDIVAVDGIPCTNIARTLCDLGAVASDDAVEQALDDALRRDVSERWIRETLERVDRPGPSGTHALRRVLARPDRAGALPDSKFERLVERILCSSILPPPVRQWPVRETGGSRRARLDLAWPDVKLAVEPSGDRFHAGIRRGRQERSRSSRPTRPSARPFGYVVGRVLGPGRVPSGDSTLNAPMSAPFAHYALRETFPLPEKLSKQFIKRPQNL
jgi:hypothetical protein